MEGATGTSRSVLYVDHLRSGTRAVMWLHYSRVRQVWSTSANLCLGCDPVDGRWKLAGKPSVAPAPVLPREWLSRLMAPRPAEPSGRCCYLLVHPPNAVRLSDADTDCEAPGSLGRSSSRSSSGDSRRLLTPLLALSLTALT